MTSPSESSGPAPPRGTEPQDTPLTEGMAFLANMGWQILLTMGLATTALGVIALVWPGATLRVLGVLFGVYLLATGVFELAGAFGTHVPRHLRAMHFLTGALSILLGLICFRGALESILLLALWIGFSWLLRGIMETAAAASAHHRSRIGRPPANSEKPHSGTGRRLGGRRGRTAADDREANALRRRSNDRSGRPPSARHHSQITVRQPRSWLIPMARSVWDVLRGSSPARAARWVHTWRPGKYARLPGSASVSRYDGRERLARQPRPPAGWCPSPVARRARRPADGGEPVPVAFAD